MSTAKINILLFEDDESQAILTREALEEQGMAVDAFGRAGDGLKAALAKTYDCFLIDIKLPDIPGVEVLRRLIAIKPGALSIIVTGHGDENAAVEAMKLGAYDYVVKSPSLGHLAALPIIIREGIERNKLKDEREALRSEIWEYSRLLAERNAELRRSRRDLKRFDALRADMISMMTHDLRNPLTTIKEFTEIISQGLVGEVNEAQKNYLQIIENNVLRLADMVSELLSLTRVEGGYVPIQKKFVGALDILKPIVESMRPFAKAKQIDLFLEMPKQNIEIFADKSRIGDVFSNLIDNAIKYTTGPGRVCVSIQEELRSILVSFTDSGAGISREDCEKIFRPKGQQTSSSDDAVSSLSISLALSQRIVELHGGRIWVESQPGRGSTFYLVLPKYTPDEMFREVVRGAFEQAKVGAGHCSLIAFSVVNINAYLHEDQGNALAAVLGALQKKLEIANYQRSADTILYWKQRHLVVIIAQEGREGAARIAERLTGVLHSEPLIVDGRPVTTAYVCATVSYPDEANSLDAMQALLQRKFGKPWDQRKRKILFIGSDMNKVEQLREALKEHPCEVVHRFHISESMVQFEEEVIDLIILDDLFGGEFRENLEQTFHQHESTKEIPVLFRESSSEALGTNKLVEKVLDTLKLKE